MIRPLTLIAACAVTMAAAEPSNLTTITFVCERGVEVPVVFINPPSDESYAVARIDDKLLGMRQVISASGARYRSEESADAYQVWTKGDWAMVSVGPDGEDTVLFQECKARH